MSRARAWHAALGAGAVCALLVAPATAGASLTVAASASPGVSTHSPAGPAKFVVQARPGRVLAAKAATRSAGGTPTGDLPVIDGFTATLSSTALRRVTADPAVRAVTANSPGKFATVSYAGGVVASDYSRTAGAYRAWRRGASGAGVTVAVIDTGVGPAASLSGRVFPGPDFSGEGNSRADSFGHGTVMAGIIAGSADSDDHADGPLAGMAPRARIVSVKVAGRNGAADVSTVLKAMQWVATFHDELDIRVVNLSWGTSSSQTAAVDPLDFAVERLWRLGVVVVVAAGNSGPADGTIRTPADDPAVITAGAYDDNQDTDQGNDSVPSWSGRGPTSEGVAKPDLVAPGQFVVGPLSRGSLIDVTFPQGRVGLDNIRGSGTSQAAAVTSGAVSLVLGRNPSFTPDEVKFAVTSTAKPISAASPTEQGNGRLAVDDALAADVTDAPIQQLAATGLGSLEASRSGRHIDTACPGESIPTTVVGEVDEHCQPWDAASWSAASWSAASWSADVWDAASWSAASWSAASWSAASWSAASWSAASWSAASWSAASWSAASWSANGFLADFWGATPPAIAP